MRSGVPYIFKRYSKASNKYLKSYDSRQESNILYTQTGVYLPTSNFKWIDLKDIDSNKYSSTTSKGCVLEVELEYQKELPELHNDYFLAPYKIEIKKEILSNYQLSITYFYNIPTEAVKKLAASFFDTESIWFVMKTYNFMRLGLKLKKNRVLEFSQSQWSVTFITQKKARNRKKVTKTEKRCTNYRKMLYMV